MSIAVLTQVYVEMRRLAIAGSVVARGDFRLKKLITPLEQAGAKAPIFSKIAQAVTALVDGPAQTSDKALLELSTLVNTVRYTQGETGIQGELQPIEGVDLGFQTSQLGARMLKPLLEALSIDGSGRLELIQDAFERGVFRDLRLVLPSLKALDDKYYGVAEYMFQSVVPSLGTTIVPILKQDFRNSKESKGNARRLLLLHQLDPEGSREIVIQAVDGDSKDVRVAAISCLGGSPDDLELLRSQLTAGAKDVREAALKSLLKVNSPVAEDMLIKHIAKQDLDRVHHDLSQNRSPKLLTFLLDQCGQEFERLIRASDKDSAAESNHRLHYLIHTLDSRTDEATHEFVAQCLARYDELVQTKVANNGALIILGLVTVLSNGSAKMQETLARSHEKLDSRYMECVLKAACLSMMPAAVFDLFSPYLIARAGRKPDSEIVEKHKSIIEVLSSNTISRQDEDVDSVEIQWDPRWLELAVRLKDIGVVCSLARPGNATVNHLLTEAVDETLERSKKLGDLEHLLKTMAKIQHSGATDSVIKVLTKLASPTVKQVNGIHNYSDIIRQLPMSAAIKLEKLLPTLHEKAIAALGDAVTELKAEKAP